MIVNQEVFSMAYGRISKKQQEILDYIKNEILNRGFPPAVREICEAVLLFTLTWKLSKKTVIYAEMPRNHVQLKSLMIILTLSAEKL